MSDLFNLVMLICAAVGSMAFGVLAAYAIFRIGFYLMRPHKPNSATIEAPPDAAGLLVD